MRYLILFCLLAVIPAHAIAAPITATDIAGKICAGTYRVEKGRDVGTKGPISYAFRQNGTGVTVDVTTDVRRTSNVTLGEGITFTTTETGFKHDYRLEHTNDGVQLVGQMSATVKGPRGPSDVKISVIAPCK